MKIAKGIVKSEGNLKIYGKDKFLEQVQGVVTTADYLSQLALRVAGTIQEQVTGIKEKVGGLVKSYEEKCQLP